MTDTGPLDPADPRARQLPWARPLRRRCRARTATHPLGGRCELAPHGEDIDHALERGMGVVLRWSTRWTDSGALLPARDGCPGPHLVPINEAEDTW